MQRRRKPDLKKRYMLGALLSVATNLSAQAQPELNAHHVTFKWLENAVSIASEGCVERYESSSWSYEHSLQQMLATMRSGSFVSRLDAYEGEPSGENRAWWSSTVFSANMISPGGISLRRAEDRRLIIESEEGDEEFTWSCHQLSIKFNQFAAYTSADGEPPAIEQLSFEINDWSLGEEMFAAFERLMVLEPIERVNPE